MSRVARRSPAGRGEARHRLAFAPEKVVDVWTGLVAGLVVALISRAVSGSSAFDRLFFDLAVGVAGALLGRWLFNRFDLQIPVAGQPGTILVAAIGAVGLLVLVRIARPRHRSMW